MVNIIGIALSNNTFLSLILLYYMIYPISYASSSLIELSTQGSYETQLFFKETNINCTLLISISNQTTWIAPEVTDRDELLLISESQSGTDDVEMRYQNITFTGKEIPFSVYIASNKDDNTYIDNYPIFIFKLPSVGYIGYSGQLGLGFTPPSNEEYSLLHQYKKKGVIDKLAFSIVSTKSGNSVYLGGIPDHLNHSLFHSYCNVIGLNNHWDCLMKKVILINHQGKKYSFNLNTSEYSGYMHFDIETHYILAPSKFIKQLGNDYLEDYLNIHVCNYEYVNKIGQYICNFNERYQNGTITFVIDNYAYTYDLNSFWSCDLDYCNFLIVENPYGDYWVMGTKFLSKNDMLFNYEDSKIHFYTHKKKVRYYVEYLNAKIGILLGSIIILLLGVGLNSSFRKGRIFI